MTYEYDQELYAEQVADLLEENDLIIPEERDDLVDYIKGW